MDRVYIAKEAAKKYWPDEEGLKKLEIAVLAYIDIDEALNDIQNKYGISVDWDGQVEVDGIIFDEDQLTTECIWKNKHFGKNLTIDDK